MRISAFRSSKIYSFVLALCAFFVFSAPALADMKQIKAYKEAYPDEKAKCACCHTTAAPKKDDGQHDLNDYGKKVKSIKAEPDADAYKQAGKAPESTK